MLIQSMTLVVEFLIVKKVEADIMPTRVSILSAGGYSLASSEKTSLLQAVLENPTRDSIEWIHR